MAAGLALCTLMATTASYGEARRDSLGGTGITLYERSVSFPTVRLEVTFGP
jgi:hypothetical protein